MGLSAVIRRPDRQPLGSVEEVQQKVIDAFPGTSFAIEHGQGAIQPRGFSVGALLLRFFRARYPYCEGHYEGKEFAVTFNLGSEPTVRAIRVTLYGRGTVAATSQFENLYKTTGWKIRY
jgi:hypothetical protein